MDNKKIYILIFIFWLTGCGPLGDINEDSMPERSNVHSFGEHIFTFTWIDDVTILSSTAKMRVSALRTRTHQPEFSARFRGSLLALFGDPVQHGAHADGAFMYIFDVQNGRGEHWILTAYDGPSGPAFGGPMKATTAERVLAAEALLDLIETTPPADFEATLQALDGASVITYGCQDGVCYWHEQKR